jgi:hypothetical protein
MTRALLNVESSTATGFETWLEGNANIVLFLTGLIKLKVENKQFRV